MKPVECEAAEDVAPGLKGIISGNFHGSNYHVVFIAPLTYPSPVSSEAKKCGHLTVWGEKNPKTKTWSSLFKAKHQQAPQRYLVDQYMNFTFQKVQLN